MTLLADSWNVAGGWRYYPVPDERIVLEKDQRLVVRISTVVFEESGTPAA